MLAFKTYHVSGLSALATANGSYAVGTHDEHAVNMCGMMAVPQDCSYLKGSCIHGSGKDVPLQ